jgi:hypothetical protein
VACRHFRRSFGHVPDCVSWRPQARKQRNPMVGKHDFTKRRQPGWPRDEK